MPSDLRTCTICPKSARFSDVSHLLTHIGSKGHLSNLHTLQIKSNQDLAAAHRLAVFDQWYQEHDMANLLSVRMRQKEEKRATKKAMQQARLSSTPGSTITKTASKKARKASLTSSIPSSESVPPVIKRSDSDDDFRASVYTTPRHSSYPAISTPLQSASNNGDSVNDVLPVLSGDELSPIKSSPGTLQLKGEILPGMDLFDAAPEEQRRKRNQKKDVSVLRQLEHYASLVQPTEVVHAAMNLDRVLKRRAMEDLENDSPVEGEEPMPTPLRKRTTASRAQRIKREAKENKDFKPKKRGRPRKQLQTPIRGITSVIDEEPDSSSRFSATEDEGRQFKLTFRNLRSRRKPKAFTVYQDPPSSFSIDGSSELVSGYVDAGDAGTQLSYPAPQWQRQQHDSYDPFKAVRPRLPPADFSEISLEKENANPLILGSNNADIYQNINPLLMHGGGDKEMPQALSMTSRLNAALTTPRTGKENMLQVSQPSQRLFENSSDLFADQDTFLPIRNPLMAALSRLGSPVKQDSFGFNGFPNAFSPQYRQPLFAP